MALDEYPAIWERYGDLAGRAWDAWLGQIAGHNLLLRESLQRRLGALEAELSLGRSSPLERLVIGRVVACWLLAEYAESAWTRLAEADFSPLREALKLQAGAHRRLLAAVRQLATIRKLLPPPPRLHRPPGT